jgi:hypothetical protein
VQLFVHRRLPATAAVLLPCILWVTQSASAGASGKPSPAQKETSVVEQLVSSANRHSLPAVSSLFASSAVLQVAKHRWSGRSAIQTWWRGEFAHHIHVSLRSSVQVADKVANAVIWRTTRGGDCAKGCLERANWRFTGSRLGQMTLTAFSRPLPPTPRPPATVPTPPKGTPLPNVTPTIPT